MRRGCWRCWGQTRRVAEEVAAVEDLLAGKTVIRVLVVLCDDCRRLAALENEAAELRSGVQ